MAIDVYSQDGKKVSSVTPKAGVFDGPVNEDLFYEVVKMQRANRRRGTASTKTRSEVAGSNQKPWKQKGSGRARAGTRKSPIWRHGGTVFGPKPRDYSYKVPKKVVKGAIKSAVAYKINEGRIKVLDGLTLSEPKTKLALDMLVKLGFDNALVVTGGSDNNIKLATRNLQGYKHLDVSAINVYDILKYDGFVITKDAFETIETTFGCKAEG